MPGQGRFVVDPAGVGPHREDDGGVDGPGAVDLQQHRGLGGHDLPQLGLVRASARRGVGRSWRPAGWPRRGRSRLAGDSVRVRHRLIARIWARVGLARASRPRSWTRSSAVNALIERVDSWLIRSRAASSTFSASWSSPARTSASRSGRLASGLRAALIASMVSFLSPPRSRLGEGASTTR